MTNHRIIARQVVDAIQSVIGKEPASLHEPTFGGNEVKYVEQCINSTFVSSIGEFVERFEQEIAHFTGAVYAIATVNGTAALHIALMLAGVVTDDEVLTPALTFVATANAVAYCGAFPHFIDTEETNLGIDIEKLRTYLDHATRLEGGLCINRLTGRVIRAIVPMHTFGHPVDMDALFELASDFCLVIVEDSAESLGSTYKGKHTGTFGLLGITSFNGNKTITTGGGGVIITDDRSLAKQAKHLTTTAKISHQWDFRHDQIGYNYRMPNINAALGCAQIEQLSGFIENQRNLYIRYAEAFDNIEGIRVLSEPEGCRSNYWLQTLVLDDAISNMQGEILKLANSAGLAVRPPWVLMSELRQFADNPKMNLSCAESIFSRVINIPSSPKLISGSC